jgi:hypothetical protein
MSAKEKAPAATEALQLNTQPKSIMLVNNLANKPHPISDDLLFLAVAADDIALEKEVSLSDLIQVRIICGRLLETLAKMGVIR